MKSFDIYTKDYGRLTADEEKALLMRKDDPEARAELVQKNLRLVVWCATPYLNQGIDADDLLQEGTCALIKAIERFDVTKGGRLSTYAVPVIKRHLMRVCCTDGIIRHTMSTPAPAVVSGDVPLTDDTENSLWDVLPTPDVPDRTKQTLAVQYALSQLDEREQDALKQVYLGSGETLKAFAARVGFTDTYIHMLKYEALRKLRDPDIIDHMREILGEAAI